MKLSFWVTTLLLAAAGSSASPTARSNHQGNHHHHHQEGHHLPANPAPPRHHIKKTCVILPVPHGRDTSTNILKTFKRCSSHSRVVFSKGVNYFVEKPMNISGLNDVEISIQGNITFSDRNITWWQENLFLLNFQSAGTWWIIGGNDITVNGGGVVDGQGQVWWNAVAKDPRPVTMVFDKVKNLHVSDFTMVQAPFWHFFVRDTQDAHFTDLYIRSVSNDTQYHPRNSDGIDTYRTRNMIFENSVIVNHDDCFSFKTNSTDMIVRNLDCTGSHGLSIGSLGQYWINGQIDVVENILVSNITCRDCENGARIKTWAGGIGSIQNVTFTDMEVTNADNPVVITTHYCDNNQMDYCIGSDLESLSIHDIAFNNIHGSASNAGKPIINLNCSDNTPCYNLALTNINITPASNTPPNVCDDVIGADKIPYCPQYSK